MHERTSSELSILDGTSITSIEVRETACEIGYILLFLFLPHKCIDHACHLSSGDLFSCISVTISEGKIIFERMVEVSHVPLSRGFLCSDAIGFVDDLESFGIVDIIGWSKFSIIVSFNNSKIFCSTNISSEPLVFDIWKTPFLSFHVLCLYGF
ncbi:Uncharacterised protein [Candidatus Venteria ishoeyi]|uniref:Uncharacterized protein n=1 Tax=Candidatus Venteria ishoeyi TaxID=1899563 RepID=A0A1H6F6D4_9GAMM|nr:Uncharacterised protein [Candidatus Venteria ishoeyi]